MLIPSEESTLGEVLTEAASRWADLPLLAVPASSDRSYATDGVEFTYAQFLDRVTHLREIYASAGYGVGHRVGVLLENRPEAFFHKLAMNSLGVCCVPLNPDHRPAELAYVIGHARLDLIVALDYLMPSITSALRHTEQRPELQLLSHATEVMPKPVRKREKRDVIASDISSILYTSGTTGKPKGCQLSHRYEIAAGQWYAKRGGLAQFLDGEDRIYNPLPLFHINSLIFSFFCALLRGNCQIQADRFRPSRWFDEVYQSRATIIHYLGVVVPMLLNQPSHPLERAHNIRFGIGAGVDPQRHAEFEDRFGYPLIEIWGMTEMVRALFNADEPRQVGTSAIGRTQPGLDVRVVDDDGEDVPDGTPGQMLVRHSAETPRKDCFSGYLDDDDATEEAWKGGWFHTGDMVWRDADGLFHFLERRKNIIRRSGENIAAAEVEAVLQSHPDVAQAVVLSVPDEVRGEEVLACVVLKNEQNKNIMLDDSSVASILAHCNEYLSYFKTPGWLWFTDKIPTTGTQKVQKHKLFDEKTDPRTVSGMLDLRHLKKRRVSIG